jgi:hypothetical protein
MHPPFGWTSPAAVRIALGATFILLGLASRSLAQGPSAPISVATFESQDFDQSASEGESGLLATIAESLFGDVYAEGRWRPLALGSFFTEGWLEPWAAPPAGREGLTPRHGWLGAFNGVFYRLWTAELAYSNSINDTYHGNRYSAEFELFLPLSKRFEVRVEDLVLVSNGTIDKRRRHLAQTGDLTITPRVLLAEDAATSHVFALAVRTPTGSQATGGGIMAMMPRYEFWTNPVGPWVVRGSADLFVPIGEVPPSSHTALAGGLAMGRYFTPHDVPFGDLAFYVACDFSVPLDRTAATFTDVFLGPGTRFHLGRSFYLLNFWSFLVTGPRPDTYSTQFALVKIF